MDFKKGSMFNPFPVVILLVISGVFVKLNIKSRKKINNDILFLFSRYFLLNIIFIFIYYFFCSSEEDWGYDEQGLDYSNNKFFYAVYHTFMVSTTIGDVHPRSIKARSITLIQAMCDFYLFGNIIYYLAYKEVNGF
tara:strand:- start:145 stop:552 length:408 start_codon:yes stop_codon:yes gene_type:complete